MATRLNEYIKTYDGMVDDDFCLDVIKAFHESDSVYTDREQRPTFRELNISQRYLSKDPLWQIPQQKLNDVFNDVVELYMTELDLGADFPARYAYEEFRLKMYQNNNYDQFKDHVDVGDYNSARRFLVLFLYLNDVVEGGETNFPRLNYKVSPKRGRILVFPATWQWRHAGLPPVSDSKMIIGTYLHYV
ncbi:2-oxoglutarate/Fe(II)-dependent oxygenase [Synechococcus phage S-8S29]|nr:2-oxoglutarate/Fe(II)-dependent oxygenase [Synechococcus phage S-8S29]